MNYYPHHLGDYAKDTKHLSLIEHGAYRCMLDVYYATEKPLPKDRQALYRLVGARSGQERKAVDVVLAEFFNDSPDGWRNTRADREIASWQDKSGKSKFAASKRWSNANACANAVQTDMRTHCEGNASLGNANQSQSQSQRPKPEPKAVDVLASIERSAMHLRRRSKFD